MDIESGLFGVAGVIIGASISALANYRTANAGRKWKSAMRDIRLLADQVTSYHCLERFYSERIAELDPGAGAPRAIKIKMRDIVSEQGQARPTMTEQRAKRIKERWGD